MKLEKNVYLKKVKPLLQKLLDQLLGKYEYASILAVDSKSKNYAVSKRGVTVSDDSTFYARGFVVKIYHDASYVEYSFNKISDDSIGDIMDKIESELILSKISNDKIRYPIPDDEALTLFETTEYELHPTEVGDQEIIRHLTEIRTKAMNTDERILDCNAVCAYQECGKIFLSRNRNLEQNVMWTVGYMILMASKDDEIKDSFQSYSCLGGLEILKEVERDIEKTSKNVIALLDSEQIRPGEYECICAPDVTGMIVHEAFGHGVEMDMFVKKRALAEEYMNKYVASPLVTMHDTSAGVNQTATYFFDDEGVLASDTVVIEQGILKTGISDMQSAVKLSKASTGNGRRESYERKAYTRMTNTFFEAGQDRMEDMIASVSYGFLLEDADSGMEDPKNWGIQCMVNVAKEIKDGKLTGKIFSPIVLTGYVPDLLKSISMVSDKIELHGSGFCGKGYKEWVKVSDGGPYIKAKIRLG